MIELRWRQMQDARLHAVHGDWMFDILRVANYVRAHPAMVYDYEASAKHLTTPTDLGTHTDSKAARAKCVEFINSKAGDLSCPKQ